LLPDIQIEILI